MTDDDALDTVLDENESVASAHLDTHRTRLEAIVNADIRCLWSAGKLLPTNEWPDRESMAVERVHLDPRTGGVTQIVLAPRSRALESLARLDALYKKDDTDADHPFVVALKRCKRDDLREIIRYIDMLGAHANTDDT